MPVSAVMPIRVAIHTALQGNVTIGANDVPIIANVVPKQEYPYITIGLITEGSMDTHGDFGSDCTADIHIWGRSAVGQTYDYDTQDSMNDQIRQALHGKRLTVSVGSFPMFQADGDTQVVEEAGGRTLHTIARYRVTLCGL